jgi:hypothetical protein
MKKSARIEQLTACRGCFTVLYELQLLSGRPHRFVRVAYPDGDRRSLFQWILVIENDGPLDDCSSTNVHATSLAQDEVRKGARLSGGRGGDLAAVELGQGAGLEPRPDINNV